MAEKASPALPTNCAVVPYEKISDALTVMTRKDAMDGEMA